MKNRRVQILAAAAWITASMFAQAPERPGGSERKTYALGPDDVISIRALDADEISDKPVRVGPDGSIHLPMVGQVQAAGLTTDQLQAELANRLKKFIRNPEVSVNIVELHSQPVSVIGAVKAPGVQQLQGRKTLIEVLSLAGGVSQDAGYSIKVTRQKEWGPIPLPNATTDPTGQFSVAELSLKDIVDARNPAQNIMIMPNDIISVPRGEMVYVIGDVKRSGGFVLGDKAHLSTLQALSMAGGLERSAAPQKATILRASMSAGGKRAEIPVKLKDILEGKGPDLAMQADDILVVPGSRSRIALVRGLESALQIGTGMAIYRSY